MTKDKYPDDGWSAEEGGGVLRTYTGGTRGHGGDLYRPSSPREELSLRKMICNRKTKSDGRR